MILYYFPIAQNTVNKTVSDFFQRYICLYIGRAKLWQTRNIFKKDIQRHSKENIHLKSCCNCKMFFFMHKRLVLDVD